MNLPSCICVKCGSDNIILNNGSGKCNNCNVKYKFACTTSFISIEEMKKEISEFWKIFEKFLKEIYVK